MESTIKSQLQQMLKELTLLYRFLTYRTRMTRRRSFWLVSEVEQPEAVVPAPTPLPVDHSEGEEDNQSLSMILTPGYD